IFKISINFFLSKIFFCGLKPSLLAMGSTAEEIGKGGICKINCEKLIDDDLEDDIECLTKIVGDFQKRNWEEPWGGPSSLFVPFPIFEQKEILESCEEPETKAWSSLKDCLTNFPHFEYHHFTSGFEGVPATKHEFPHAAAIGWTDPDTNSIKWGCGGSLITEDVILTASHCTMNREKQAPDVVRLGDLNIESDHEDTDAQQFKVHSIIRHPDFKLRYHDIALIKLDRRVNITNFVMPACLWDKFELPRDVELEACGYGQTEFMGPISPVLIKVVVTEVGKDECQSYYDDDRKLRNGLDGRIHLCANDKTGHQMDTCDGDSGGPLEMKLLNYDLKVPFLVGVTAFGKVCGFDSPAVYTRVSAYMEWIKKFVPEVESDPLKCSQQYMEYRQIVNRIGNNFDPQKPLLSSSNDQVATATIISDQYLITTASSLQKLSTKPDRVQLQSNQSQIMIEKIINHPKYSEGKLENDVALIKLHNRIRWCQADHPSCLSENSFEIIAPTFQQETYINRPNFDSKYRNISTIYCLESNQLCYKSDFYHIPGLCYVPSSSPIVKEYFPTNQLQTLVEGLAIKSDDCTFTRAVDVSKHFNWINSVVFENEVDAPVFNEDSALKRGEIC
ncbi:ovochymase-2-like, partial [Culicoides brevitarsis]|uniref:ovochymase-2-like n=1 Tax=Culicoides brevitarsis TaxID=469753 RepID=UPI00307C36CE